MGRASISIAITSNFDSKGIDAAQRKMEQLAVKSTSLKGKYGKDLVDSGAALGIASARLDRWGQSVARIGDTLTTHVTLPMGVMAGAAIKYATDIDTAWYGVRKTVDMTEEGYRRLREGAIALSDVQPVSAAELLDIEALGGQLGITNDNLEDFARIVSGLDIATNLDSQTAATELAQFRNVVQMSEDDLDNMASTVVDLGNHTATTEADIMQLALRFASAGHVAGMSNQDILGLSAALAGLGMKADAGGSALSQVINKISLDVAKGGADVQKWADLVGEAPDKFARAWREAPTEQFVKVLQAISQDGADANEILNDLGITQIRQSDAMRRLASSGDLVTESIERANQAWRDNTALTKEVDNRNESIQARWDTLKNRITNDLALIGDPLANIGLDMLEGLEPAIEGVGGLAEAFNRADPSTQRYAANLMLVAAAAGPVLSVTGRLMQSAGKFGTKIARLQQQYGVYTEALNTNDVALIRNFSAQDTLATRLGLSRNAAVRAAGGIDSYLNRVAAATQVIGDNAKAQVRNSTAVQAYAKALGVGSDSTARFSGGVRSSAEAVQFATGVNQRYKAALAGGAKSATEAAQMALQYKDNTSASAFAANRAANEALGYGGALKSQAKSGTAAANAALKAAGSRKTELAATRAATEATGKMTQAEVDAALATDEGSAALERQSESARKSSLSLTGVKSVLLGLGGIAAGLAIGAGITWIVTQMQEAAERADELDKATNGLRSSLAATGEAAENAGNAQRDLIGAIADTHERVREAISDQAELADSFHEADKQAAVQMGTIDRSAEIIDKYANKGSVGTAQLTLLKNAIEDVNQACDTQYQVLSDGTVIIEGETGAIQVNTDEILKNIDARKRQIQLDALETKYQSAYENLLDQQYARADAMDKLAKAQERYNELREKGLSFLSDSEILEYSNLQVEIPKLEQDVDEANQTFEEAKNAADRLGTALENAGAKAATLGEGMQRIVDPASSFATWFDIAGKDVYEFAAACEEAGINWQFLNSLTEEEIQSLASDFDGSITSIIRSLEDLGRTDALENLGDNWRSSIDDASKQLADGIASAHDVSLAELSALASDLGIEGDEAMRGFLEGIQSGLDAGLNIDQAAELAQRITQEFEDGLTPEQAAELARRFLRNLATHMGDTAAIDQAIQSLKTALSQADFSAEGANAATTFYADFRGRLQQEALDAGTVYSDTGRAVGRMLADGTVVGIAEGEPAISAEGARVPESYGQGARDNAGAAEGAGGSIVDLLLSALAGGVGRAGGIGSETGTGYGDAVAAQGHVAERAAVDTLGKLLIVWLLGVASAQQAGRRTGEGYAKALSDSSAKAVTAAQAISIATGTAFGAGRSQAASAGQSLGQAFASAVWTSGGQAIAYARSIRSSVKSIFDDMPTANIKVNVTRTVSAAPSAFGGSPVRYASAAPEAAYRVAALQDAASATRAATQAASDLRAVDRIAGAARTATAAGTASGSVQNAPVALLGAPGQGISEDSLYRIFLSAMRRAVSEMPEPVVELDGRSVSRGLAPHMDRELGRLQRMRG